MQADIDESGHRVPFIAPWPGRIRPYTVSAQTACLTGVYATLANLLSQPLDTVEAEDRFAFAAALEGRARPATG